MDETVKVEVYGIANVKKVVSFAVALGNIGDDLGHTSGVAKWGKLISVLPEVMDFAKVDFSVLKNEVKDIDATEREEILELIKSELSLVNKSLEGSIEAAIDLVEDYTKVVIKTIGYVNSLKA